MTSSPHSIVNVADLELKWLKVGNRIEVGLNDIDAAVGTEQIGATLHVVPAGKTAWPYHRHHGNDELFYVLAGEGTYRVGERRLPIKAGDVIGAPAGGEAHQIINTSGGELRYIAFANHGRADLIEYPDSGQISVGIAHGYGGSFFEVRGRVTPTEYWDGEDMEGKSNG